MHHARYRIHANQRHLAAKSAYRKNQIRDMPQESRSSKCPGGSDGISPPKVPLFPGLRSGPRHFASIFHDFGAFGASPEMIGVPRLIVFGDEGTIQLCAKKGDVLFLLVSAVADYMKLLILSHDISRRHHKEHIDAS